MADPIINEVQDSLNTSSVNGTGKVPSTPEGMALAYGSLVVMALVPIVIGSFRSVRHHKEQKVEKNFLVNFSDHFIKICFEDMPQSPISQLPTFLKNHLFMLFH